MTTGKMLDPSALEGLLDKHRERYNRCNEEDALSEPVDAEKFFRFVGSITNIKTGDDAVTVTFQEPVPGATDLSDGYKYTVSVSREECDEHFRCEMPKHDLLTLQQVAITVWAVATGEVYR